MSTKSAKSFVLSDSGVSAVEFAMVLPVMLFLMFGGYVLMESISIHRKITITTRALADLTTEYKSLTIDQMTAIINASSQIMAPFDPSSLQIRLSEVETPGRSSCVSLLPTVTWSTGYKKYNMCDPYKLPVAMTNAGTSFIISEVSYVYSPPVGYDFLGPFTIADHIVMLPRVSQSIPYPVTSQ